MKGSLGLRQIWRVSVPPKWHAQPLSSRDGAILRGSSGRCKVQKRWDTSQAGDNQSGHIIAGPDESILFFDNVFPLKLQWLLRLPFLSRSYVEKFQTLATASLDPAKVLKEALKDSRLSSSTTDVRINAVIPRFKDGGAFLRFSHTAPASALEDVMEKHLKDNPLRPWWNPFTRVRAQLVRGRPWVEDLYRLPSCRLKIEFLPSTGSSEGAELQQEQLYSLFRPYGKLLEITSQPPDSKIVPKYAYIDFASTRRATMAKSCLHGYQVVTEDGATKATKLKIAYEPRTKSNWSRDWIFSHPRVVIPLLAALLTGLAVTVFDPIRTFSIKTHIAGSFDLNQNRAYRWLQSRASQLLTFRKRADDGASMAALWDDRKGNIEQIEKWLLEATDTFIVVQGPRGSGKRELIVEQALKYRRNKLVIDCKPIQEARNDSKTIEAAAKQVGYRPIFSWINSISGLIDLAAQGAVGMKTGFSETLDTQLDKILSNTASALRQLALEGRRKSDKDANLGPDEYLEAHPEKRPVVVIDNFLHRANDSQVIYDKLAEWGAGVTSASIAHVIILTHDVSFSKSLSKALPDRVFRQINLGDFQPSVAKKFVISHLDTEPGEEVVAADGRPSTLTASQRRKDLAELDECLGSIGGRLTDLEFLARRIKSGETPKAAVGEIISQSASEIIKMYLLLNDESSRQWKPQQAWALVKALAKADELRYNELALWDAFKGASPDTVLRALEQAELISIISSHGRPQSIRANRPVFQPAFRLLADDEVLAARLDLAMLADQIKAENSAIDKLEAELELLGKLPARPSELNARVKWLLSKLQASQSNIEKYESSSDELKRILKSQF